MLLLSVISAKSRTIKQFLAKCVAVVIVAILVDRVAVDIATFFCKPKTNYLQRLSVFRPTQESS